MSVRGTTFACLGLCALVIGVKTDGVLNCESAGTCYYGERFAEAVEQGEQSGTHMELLQRGNAHVQRVSSVIVKSNTPDNHDFSTARDLTDGIPAPAAALTHGVTVLQIKAQVGSTYHFTEQFENAAGDSSQEEEACPAPCKTIFARDLFGPVVPGWPEYTLRVVGPKDSNAGFFVRPIWAMHQLEWAEERHDITKIKIFMDADMNPYFSPGHGENWWEAYFEPLDDIPCKRADFDENRTLEMSRTFYPVSAGWRLHEEIGVKAYNYRSTNKLPLHVYAGWRVRASELVRKYVRPKSHIWKLVDTYWASSGLNKASHVIGVHIRGTDKDPSIGGNIVEPFEYFPIIDRFLKAYGVEARIFMATDDPYFLKVMEDRYGSRLAVRRQTRSEINSAWDTVGDPYSKGEDVLVDCLLLSRSSFLMKSSSAVSEFAIYFNPTLHEHSYDFQISMPEPQFSPMLHNASPSAAHEAASQSASAQAWSTQEEAAVVLAATPGTNASWVAPVLEKMQHLRVVIHTDPGGDRCGLPLHPQIQIDDSGRFSSPLRGREASKYLEYIVREYDRLPAVVAFLHGHEKGWHDPSVGKITALQKLLAWRGEGIQFMEAPHCILTIGSEEDHSFVSGEDVETRRVRHLWDAQFVEKELGKFPQRGWSTPCCAQFVVSRNAILQHPKAFYEDLYEYSTTLKDSRDAGNVLEVTWVAIFTMCNGTAVDNCKAFRSGSWGGVAKEGGCPEDKLGVPGQRRFRREAFSKKHGPWNLRQGNHTDLKSKSLCSSTDAAGCPPITVASNEALSLVAEQNGQPRIAPMLKFSDMSPPEDEETSEHCECWVMSGMNNKLASSEPFGEFCAELSKTLRYSPARLTYKSCWMNEIGKLQKRIQDLQYPSTAQTPEGKVPSQRNLIILPEDGFGVIMRYAALRLHQHTAAGIQMDLADVSMHFVDELGRDEVSDWSSGIYFDSEHCPGLSGSHWLECFFRPIAERDSSGKVTDDRNCTGSSACLSCGMQLCPEKWEPAFGTLGVGRFLENAYYLQAVWQPNLKTAQWIAKRQYESGLLDVQRPLLSLHIRHGDACADNLHIRECRPVSDFVEAAEKFRRQYGAKSLFIATDSAAASTEARRLAIENGWGQVVSLNLDRGKYAVDNMIEWSTGSQMALEAIAEIESLASGDILVGQFSSNMARLALSLMVARKGFFPPFESLDIPYCDHFGRNDTVAWAGGIMAHVPYYC